MTRWRSIAIMPFLALAGCPATQPAPPATGPIVKVAPDGILAPIEPPPDAIRPAQASVMPETGPAVVALDVYQLSVPLGSISRSEEFWKRVDESAIDVGTYDVLLKNCVRVGIGDDKDWPFFKALIDNNHVSAMRGSSSPSAQGSLELKLKDHMPTEDVFWTDDHDIQTGRTFEDCENYLSITFQPHQRKLDHAILNVCPLVRGTRKFLRFTVLNHEEPELESVCPEQIFEMAVEADVPPDHFLILAPTADSHPMMSIGRTFFVKAGAAQEMETVLILSPRTLHLMQLR
jgi:hypothetical protein